MKGYMAGLILLVILVLAAVAISSSASASMSAQASIKAAENARLAMIDGIIDKLIALACLGTVFVAVAVGGLAFARKNLPTKQRKWKSGSNAYWAHEGEPERMPAPQLDQNAIAIQALGNELRALRNEIQTTNRSSNGW